MPNNWMVTGNENNSTLLSQTLDLVESRKIYSDYWFKLFARAEQIPVLHFK